jgi:DNA-binding PadR family transcriptional regulator
MLEEEIFRDMIRNISKLTILWSISRKTQSGYSIIKEMERITNQHFHPGIIYPLLYKLEERGFITGEWVQKGRKRTKYYSITDKGKEVLNRVGSRFELPLKEVLQDFLNEEH